jgi:hypothetical protein
MPEIKTTPEERGRRQKARARARRYAYLKLNGRTEDLAREFPHGFDLKVAKA